MLLQVSEMCIDRENTFVYRIASQGFKMILS